MRDPEIVFVAVAVMTGLVLVFGHFMRMLRAMMLHRTIREAISRDNESVAGLLDKIDEQQTHSGFGDDRIGVVLLALGVALVFYGLIDGDADDIRNMAGIAVFPLFVGIALLGRLWYLRRREQGAE